MVHRQNSATSTVSTFDRLSGEIIGLIGRHHGLTILLADGTHNNEIDRVDSA
jgi:hypothetical protein